LARRDHAFQHGRERAQVAPEEREQPKQMVHGRFRFRTWKRARRSEPNTHLPKDRR
jgi:hypothetical protein